MEDDYAFKKHNANQCATVDEMKKLGENSEIHDTQLPFWANGQRC